MGLPRDQTVIDPVASVLATSRHRLLDGLQLVSAMVRMQIRECEGDEARARLFRVLGSLTTVARLQRGLDGSGDHSLQAHLTLAADLWREAADARGVLVHVAINDDVTVPAPLLLPAALIVQELVSNSLEHAFPDGREGSVMITLRQDGATRASITVEDDGAGFDPAIDDPPSFGLGIVKTLALGAGAEFALHSARREGAIARLRFACPS